MSRVCLFSLTIVGLLVTVPVSAYFRSVPHPYRLAPIRTILNEPSAAILTLPKGWPLWIGHPVTDSMNHWPTWIGYVDPR